MWLYKQIGDFRCVWNQVNPEHNLTYAQRDIPMRIKPWVNFKRIVELEVTDESLIICIGYGFCDPESKLIKNVRKFSTQWRVSVSRPLPYVACWTGGWFWRWITVEMRGRRRANSVQMYYSGQQISEPCIWSPWEPLTNRQKITSAFRPIVAKHNLAVI